jgi:hypothetical protein
MKKADLEISGNSLTGKKTQSGLLIHIDDKGNKAINAYVPGDQSINIRYLNL